MFDPHNCRVSKLAGILFCSALIFVLAGCATTPGSDETLPPDWSKNGVVAKPFSVTNSMPLPTITKINLPPVIIHSNPPPAHVIKPAPILTWTSLNRWAAEQKIGPPLLLAKSPLTTYAISSGHGVMVLAIGSREATWNGLTLHLGFAPEIIDGEIFLHGLDLEKNLEPLLGEPALTFGPARVIVIDHGHGGLNAGTICALDGRPEKQFTLDWAKRLVPLLASNGWTVFLTRTNDVDVSLSTRVAFAEAHHADAFISLHFNSAAPDQKQCGLETYCLTPAGMPSTLTRGFADPWLENLPNNNFDAQNLRLAVRLHRAVLHASGEEDRGVRRARFIGVLRGQKRPAILIEGGYLSNPHEAAKIEDPAFRQKLAAAVAGALK